MIIYSMFVVANSSLWLYCFEYLFGMYRTSELRLKSNLELGLNVPKNTCNDQSRYKKNALNVSPVFELLAVF